MSQLDFIKSHIEKYGRVSRNEMMNARKTIRLSAIIHRLFKQYGYKFTRDESNNDCVYYWTDWVKPRQEVWLVKDDYGNVVDSIRKEVTMKM